MSDSFINWTSRVAIAGRVGERQRHESWNELTLRGDYHAPFGKSEARAEAAKWLCQVKLPAILSRMHNQHRRTNFTPSDDALIRLQPTSGIGLKILETMLCTNRAALMQRADELGVSLVIRSDHDGAMDTQTLRCTDGFVDRYWHG